MNNYKNKNNCCTYLCPAIQKIPISMHISISINMCVFVSVCVTLGLTLVCFGFTIGKTHTHTHVARLYDIPPPIPHLAPRSGPADRVALVTAAPPSYTRMYHYFPAHLSAHPFCYYPPPAPAPALPPPLPPAPPPQLATPLTLKQLGSSLTSMTQAAQLAKTLRYAPGNAPRYLYLYIPKTSYTLYRSEHRVPWG